MFCGKCGNRLAKINNYCNICGAAISKERQPSEKLKPEVENTNFSEIYYENISEDVINVEKNKIALEIVFLVMTIALAAILIISSYTSNII